MVVVSTDYRLVYLQATTTHTSLYKDKIISPDQSGDYYAIEVTLEELYIRDMELNHRYKPHDEELLANPKR